MMKYFPKILAALPVIFFYEASISQTYLPFIEASVLLKSDTNTKSALISNLIENGAGGQSPYIGAAKWVNSGERLQCRSLLSFDYGIWTRIINPDQITQAELILKEITSISDNENIPAQPSKFYVKRVVEPWEDSLTTWITQPGSDLFDVSKKTVNRKKTNNGEIRIDVTKIVVNMFRYGNNGFMISFPDSTESTSTLIQWFASARHQNVELRPCLLIRYTQSNISFNPNNTPLSTLPILGPYKCPGQEPSSRSFTQPVQQTPPATVTPSNEPVKPAPVKT